MFINVVFPAPDGPITADNLPDSKLPVMLLSIVLEPLKKQKNKNEKQMNL